MTTVQVILGALTVISTGIAIYQFAVIREGKKRKHEVQFLLAGVNALALQKQQSWNNQIGTLGDLHAEGMLEKAAPLVRARDDFTELAGLTSSLEGAIDTDFSAITKLMDKALAVTVKNNELQAEGLKNPTLYPKQPPLPEGGTH